MARCPFCGGRLEEEAVTHVQSYEGKVYVLENVPAEVCRQCGEVLLEPRVLEKIQQLVWSNAQPTRVAETPVYDLADVS